MVPLIALRRLTLGLALLLSAGPTCAQPDRVWPRHLAVTDYPDADAYDTGNPEVGGGEFLLAPRVDWHRPELAQYGIQTVTRRFRLYAPRRHRARETLTYDRAGRLLRYELVRRRWFGRDSLVNRFTYDDAGRMRRVAVSGSPILTIPLVFNRLWEAWDGARACPECRALRTIVIRYDSLSGRPTQYGVEMISTTYAILPGAAAQWLYFPVTRPLEYLLTRPTDTLFVRHPSRLLQPATWLLRLDSLAIGRATPSWKYGGDSSAVRRAAATGWRGIIQRGYPMSDKWSTSHDFFTAPVSETYYNPRGRVALVRDDDDVVLRYEYDSAGRLRSRTDYDIIPPAADEHYFGSYVLWYRMLPDCEKKFAQVVPLREHSVGLVRQYRRQTVTYRLDARSLPTRAVVEVRRVRSRKRVRLSATMTTRSGTHDHPNSGPYLPGGRQAERQIARADRAAARGCLPMRERVRRHGVQYQYTYFPAQ